MDDLAMDDDHPKSDDWIRSEEKCLNLLSRKIAENPDLLSNKLIGHEMRI
jgi:hypothetical protein